MPDDDPAAVAVFAALADDTRWQILQRLGAAPSSASALATELPISRQAIAKHIGVLVDVGLVTSSPVGREVRFQAVGTQLSAVARRLDRIADRWDQRLARVKDAAEKGDNPGNET